MAIPLPQLTHVPLFEMPRAPGEIPTAKDIASATVLEHNVRESYKRNINTDEDLANVVIYKTKLVAASAGGGIVPVWFGPAIANALRDVLPDLLQPITEDIRIMKGDIQTVKEDIRTIKRDLETLKEESAKTRRLAARSHNATLGTSIDAVYEIVPFQNGQDPTEAPHNLSPLTSVQAILDLTDRQLDSYLRSYHPELNNRRVIRGRNERINRIASAIGIDKIILS